MHNRPRCRDWSALATQQLRLRNLIQISGHNIECDRPNCSIYFTLHYTSMSAPFFTSERLDIRETAIWPEINCPEIFKSRATSVCIRVWQHKNLEEEASTIAEIKEEPIDDNDCGATASISISSNNKNNNNNTSRNVSRSSSSSLDTVLFLWGVYFSGLVPISKRTDVKFKKNCLVFYIHGGFFTSAEYLLPKCIPHQLEVFGVTMKRATAIKASMNDENCDQIVLSRNNSNNSIQLSTSPNTTDQQHSVDAQLLSPTIAAPEENDSNSSNCQTMLKVRFAEKNFFTSEIRPSYNVAKLLQLQDKQRQFRKKRENAKEVMDKICMKSAFCLNLDLIANKKFLLRPRGNPSMGRTLNRLLFQQQEQPKPEELLKAQAMRRQIETAKFRCRLLVQEKNQALIKIRKLEEKLGTMTDSNIEKEVWLMGCYRELSKDMEKLPDLKDSVFKLNDQLNQLLSIQRDRQLQLLRELKEIYCIKRTQKGFYSINDACLPNAENYSDLVSSADISVALGYAAHVTLMCSIILDCPLRNAIIYKGSASFIRDNTKALPDSEREFPLFCRHNPPPEPLVYAVYLLNQNISQLKFLIGLIKDDSRAVLPNLYQLLDGSSTIGLQKVNSYRCNFPHLLGPSPSSSTSSPPPPPTIASSSLELNRNNPFNGYSSITNGEKGRVSRSVEPYPNNDSISQTKSNFTSEPILNSAKSPQLSSFKVDNENI